MFLKLAVLSLLATPVISSATPDASEPVHRISVQQEDVQSFRLEVFADQGRERIYDSGIVTGHQIELQNGDIPAGVDDLVYELRTWDAEGRLVGSHMSRLGADPISSISFEQIPSPLQVVGGSIELQGPVDVDGDLSVAGTTRTAGLTDSVGGAFFGTCAAASAIRSIDTDGTVQCESTGDNLGNHQATSNIQLQGRFLSGDGDNEGLFIDSAGRVMVGTSVSNNALFRVEDAATSSRLALNTTSGGPVAFITSLDNDPSILSMVSNSASFQLRVTSDDRFHIFTTSPVVSVDPTGQVGIGIEDPSFLLHVNGSAGKPGGGSWSSASDARLKDVVDTFDRGLEALKALRPVHYRYRHDNPLDLPTEPEYVGLLAQDVQRAVPEAVSEDSAGFLRVNNDPILWAMLNAILELEQRVEACGAP